MKYAFYVFGSFFSLTKQSELETLNGSDLSKNLDNNTTFHSSGTATG